MNVNIYIYTKGCDIEKRKIVIKAPASLSDGRGESNSIFRRVLSGLQSS